MIEVFKQMVEALEYHIEQTRPILKTKKAIQVGKQAIAELESQEPVAWRTFDGEGGYDYRSYEDNENYADEWDKRNPNHKGWVDKLYTTPPQRTWVGLTDDQMEATFIECGGKWNGDFWKIEDADFHPFLRTIEAKLKQKNGYAEEKK